MLSLLKTQSCTQQKHPKFWVKPIAHDKQIYLSQIQKSSEKNFPQNKNKKQHLGFSKVVIVISAVLHQITLIYCQTLNRDKTGDFFRCIINTSGYK